MCNSSELEMAALKDIDLNFFTKFKFKHTKDHKRYLRDRAEYDAIDAVYNPPEEPSVHTTSSHASSATTT